MKRIKFIKDWAPDLLASAGGICLSVGAFLLGVAAGWAVTGTLLILAAVIVSRGGRST